MEGRVMAYGDGVNWSGTASAVFVTMYFRVQFSIVAQEVQFPVQAGQTSLNTAISLMTHWNDNWPGEAYMPTPTESTVRFKKSGQKVQSMQVKEDDGEWQDLPVTVDGYAVTNVL